MNTHLKNRIESKLTIAEANQSIKNARSKFGFTAEDRAFIKANGGKLGPWLEWKKSKSEAAKKSAATLAKKPVPASSATKQAPAASKPVTTAPAPKDDGLAISRAEFDALPPSDKMEFKRLGGQVTTASSATAPELAGLTGLARATAIHKAQAASVAPVAAKPATAPTASKPATPAPASDKPAPQPNITGAARTAAAFAGKPASPRNVAPLTGHARAAAALAKKDK